MSNQPPSQADVRKARHTGFLNSVRNRPVPQQKELYARYKTQDARREKNVSGFVNQVRAK